MDTGSEESPIKRRCKGTVKATGEQCRKSAIKGTTVCRSHGGAAPQVRRKAAENVAAEELRKVVRHWDLSTARDLTPREGILEEWRRVIVVVDYLDGLVSAESYDAVGAPELPGPGDKRGAEYLRALVQWRDVEITRKIKLGLDLEKLGLSERELELQEQHLQSLSALMVGAMSRAGADDALIEETMRQLAAPSTSKK